MIILPLLTGLDYLSAMTIWLIALIVVIFLAYANGANDNFKGVATLFGSHTLSYKKALTLTTIATLLGSLAAFVLAQGLLTTFSGKGLVPDHLIANETFPLAVGLGSALTVMLATKFGFPISTTHALTGSLVGVGLMASDVGVNFPLLLKNFMLPMLVSPVTAMVLAAVLYPVFRFYRRRLRVDEGSCVCVGVPEPTVLGVTPSSNPAIAAYATASLPAVGVGTSTAVCHVKFSAGYAGVEARGILDVLHILSGGIVCFARGLNDTPKLAAIALTAGAVSADFAIFTTAVAMLIGGLLNSRKVAETMALKVTPMNAGQGFTANLVTGLLVIFASKLGLPVSTTHVSCGAIFGIGLTTKQANLKTILSICLAWVTTLPLAALLSMAIFALIA